MVVLPAPAGPTTTSSTVSEPTTAATASAWSSSSPASCAAATSLRGRRRRRVPSGVAASSSSASAPSSSAVVYRSSPRRARRSGSGTSRRIHPSEACDTSWSVSRNRCFGEAIARSAEARSTEAARFHVDHTDRRADASSTAAATIRSLTCGPTSCACSDRPYPPARAAAARSSGSRPVRARARLAHSVSSSRSERTTFAGRVARVRCSRALVVSTRDGPRP